MNDKLDLHDMLPQLNADGHEYKILIGDPSRSPLYDPQRLPNDLDRGSIENVVLWSCGLQNRAVNEVNLREARGLFLDAWADFLGFKRQSGQSDEEFIGFILGTILSSIATRPAIDNLLPDPPFRRYAARKTGFFAGVACASTPIVRPGRHRLAAAICTQRSNATYTYVDDLAELTDLIRAAVLTMLAAGIDIFVGEY